MPQKRRILNNKRAYSFSYSSFFMETGKIIIMVAFLVLGVVLGSTVGYSVGKAYGTSETKLKIAKENYDAQINASEQTSGAYGAIPSDPLEDVTINPFE